MGTTAQRSTTGAMRTMRDHCFETMKYRTISMNAIGHKKMNIQRTMLDIPKRYSMRLYPKECEMTLHIVGEPCSEKFIINIIFYHHAVVRSDCFFTGIFDLTM